MAVSSPPRDVLLDAMRAYTMIYIVCVVHLLYWWQWPSCPFVSFLLVEMPAIFFIAGASARHSRSRSFRQLLSGRFRRVLWPYYFYAALSLLLLYLSGMASGSMGLREVLMVLLADDIPRLPYAWHLWFILPYLLVSLSFYFQRQWAERYGLRYLLLLVVLMCMADGAFRLTGTDLHQLVGWRRIVSHQLLYFLCYNIFFVSGFLLYRHLSVARTLTVLLVSVVLSGVLSGGHVPDFQSEKFPPTTLFMLYGIASLCLLSLVIRHTGLPCPRIVVFWNRHGYTLYLYQNYCMWLFVSVIAPVLVSVFPYWLEIPVGMVILFVLNTVLAYLLIQCFSSASSIISRSPWLSP